MKNKKEKVGRRERGGDRKEEEGGREREVIL